MKRQKTFMAIGSPNYLNGIATQSEDILLVELQKSDCFDSGYNTVIVSFDILYEVKYCILNYSETFTWKYVESCLFKDMCTDQKLVQGNEALKYSIPLFVFSWIEDPTTKTFEDVHVYSMIRFTNENTLFIRTNNEVISLNNTTNEVLFFKLLFKTALQKHEKNSLFLNNHQCYYRKLFNEYELENKFLLTSNRDDIWALTVDFYHRIQNLELKGYIPEYKDEFQAWDYWNYLFEVVEPFHEVGYISLIPTTDGKCTIKRKWYAEDRFMRRENHYKQQVIEIPYKSYIEERFEVKTIEYPPFRRVRYDVNFESTRSGHVYGIFFDQTTINDLNKTKMTQCEVEYLRSRTLISLDEKVILDEMKKITEWVAHVLRSLNVGFNRTFYSKLTFLKDNC